MTIRPSILRMADPYPANKLSLSTIEAAEALGISARTLHDLTAPRGPIRVARAGRRRLYPIEELKRFLADSCAASGTR